MLQRSALQLGLNWTKRIAGSGVRNGALASYRKRLLPLMRVDATYSTPFRLFSDEIDIGEVRARSVPKNVLTKHNLIRLYKAGQIKIPEPREITSLPPQKTFVGNEDFIAFEIVIIPEREGNYSSYPLTMTAVSDKGKIELVCKPKVELYKSVTGVSGISYDATNDQVLRFGLPVDTVTPEDATRQFVDFVKGHQNPLLLNYGRKSMVKLIKVLTHYGLYEELVTVAPFKINTNIFPRKEFDRQVSLQYLIKEHTNKDLRDGNQLERCEGHLSLFKEKYLMIGTSDCVDSTDTAWALDTYLELIDKDVVDFIAFQKLSRGGIGLDHLKFLSQQGYDKFRSYLTENANVFPVDIDKLYKIVSMS